MALKNRNIGVQENFEVIKELIEIAFDFFENEKPRYNLFWELPKFFDLLTILSTLEKNHDKYSFYLLEFIQIYSIQSIGKKEGISYEDHLKLLKVMVDFQDKLDPELLKNCFLRFTKNTKEFRKCNSKMILQFALLLNKSSLGDSYPNWQVVIGRMNQYKGRLKLHDVRRELDSLNLYEDELFYEFNNNFYYEIHGTDSIPYFFLRRSILHRDED